MIFISIVTPARPIKTSRRERERELMIFISIGGTCKAYKTI